MKKTIIYTLVFSTALLLTGCQAIEGLFSDSYDDGYRNYAPAPNRATVSRSPAATSATATPSSSRSASGSTAVPSKPVTSSTASKARAVVPVEPPIAAPKAASGSVVLPKADSAVNVPAAPVNVPTTLPEMAPPLLE